MASVILPVVAIIFRYKRLAKALKILALYIFISGLTDILLFVLAHYLKRNNLFVLRGFTVVEFTLLTLFLREQFSGKWLKNTTLAAIFIFGMFAVISALYFQSVQEFDNYVAGIESALMVLFCLGYFYRAFTEAKIIRLEKNSSFWICTAILFYFSGNLFLFLCFDSSLISAKEYFFKYWEIQYALDSIFNMLLGVGIWIIHRK